MPGKGGGGVVHRCGRRRDIATDENQMDTDKKAFCLYRCRNPFISLHPEKIFHHGGSWVHLILSAAGFA
jgi:hypothetical protein